MATRTAEVSGAPVSVGRVLERGFASIAANPLTILGIALLLGAVPSIVLAYVQSQLGAGGGAVAAFGWASAVVNIVNFTLSFLVHGAVVHAVLAHLDGRRRAGWGECLASSLGVLLPMIGLAILIFVAVMFGFALLIVPGVMLYVLWSVASPALVAERAGAFDALGRSRRLTKGARWRVFGLQLILLAVYYLIVGTLGYGTVVAGGGLDAVTRGGVGTLPVAATVLNAIVGALATTAWSTIQTALYTELRDRHDGPSADHLADVFA